MIHFAVFGYIIVILIGVICLTVAYLFYLKIRSKFLYRFLVHFSVFTILIFFYLLVLTYINANYTRVNFFFMIPVLGIIIISYSLLLYSILHFGFFQDSKIPSKRKNSVEILISIASLIGIISSFRIDWAQQQITQKINVGLLFSFALLFFAIIYSSFLKLQKLKKMDAESKQINMRTSIMTLIFVPGLVLDIYLLKTINYSLIIPVFYLCYSIVFVQYVIKKYNSDLLSGRSAEDQNELDNYFNEAGISAREKEIITLIMKGYSNQKISDLLFISLSTVKTHIRNIFQKLNVKSRFEIIYRVTNDQSN